MTTAQPLSHCTLLHPILLSKRLVFVGCSNITSHFRGCFLFLFISLWVVIRIICFVLLHISGKVEWKCWNNLRIVVSCFPVWTISFFSFRILKAKNWWFFQEKKWFQTWLIITILKCNDPYWSQQDWIIYGE